MRGMWMSCFKVLISSPSLPHALLLLLLVMITKGEGIARLLDPLQGQKIESNACYMPFKAKIYAADHRTSHDHYYYYAHHQQ